MHGKERKEILLTVLELFRSLFYLLFDRVGLFHSRQDCTGSTKKVLIVKFDAVGDFILWLDAAKQFRNLYPKGSCQITLLGNSSWTPLAELLPYFDSVWQVDRRRFFKDPLYRWQILKTVRHYEFDVVINPSFSREFLFGDSVVRASQAPEMIGSGGDFSNIESWQKRISDNWYTRIIPAVNEPLMELLRNAEFMRGLGLLEFKANIPELAVDMILPDGFQLHQYYVLFPGSSVGAKQWPTSSFAALACRMYKETGLVGVICGGPSEMILGIEITKQANVPLQNWVSRTSLQELAAIIMNAQLLVGNDTSAIHIAAAVSTPSVCIVGGGHFGRFLPYQVEVVTERPLPAIVYNELECFGCNWKCIYDPSLKRTAPCLEKITVDDVWEAVETVRRERGLC